LTATYDLCQAVHHGLDGKTRGVELDGTLRTAERCRLSFAVAAVAALDLMQDLGDVRLLTAGAELQRTASGAAFEVGGEVDLHLGVREHDGSEVTSLCDDAALARETPL
jgi:hypothetical protein